MLNRGANRKIRYAPVNTTDQTWLDKAACRGVPMKDGYSIFFPKIIEPAGRPTTKEHREAPLTIYYKEALALCNRCPVISDCYKEFTRDPIPQTGMFFGKTPSQRTRLKTRMHEEMLANIRELVPFGVHIDDSTTEDAQRINDIHKVLWGVNIPGYEDGFWE